MKSLTLICLSCRKSWPTPRGECAYERSALEAQPCPHCGALTLSVRAAAKPASRRRIVFPAPPRNDAA